MKYVRHFVFYVVFCSILFYVIANYFPGFNFSLQSDYANAIVVYLFVGVVSWVINVVFRKILTVLTIPVSILTFGGISLIINFLLLYVFEQFINYLDVGVEIHLGNVLQVFVLSLLLSVVYLLTKKI